MPDIRPTWLHLFLYNLCGRLGIWYQVGCSVMGNRYWNHPPCPDTIVTICVSYFTNGDPSKQHGTNKPPPISRIWERSKGCHVSYHLPESFWLESILAEWCWATRKEEPESEWLARDNLETNPITINSETVSHLAEQFSWLPLPSCFQPGLPFPIKSLALKHMCLLGQFISECYTRAQFWALEGVPLLATVQLINSALNPLY